MRIIVTAPHGLELEVDDVDPTALGPDGIDMTLRQIADAYKRLVTIDIEAGLADAYVLDQVPEVETELGDDEDVPE